MALVHCEITVVRLTNLDLDHLPDGKLFVRYFVYAGGGRRIRIDTSEIPCTSNPLYWNETSTLECHNAGSDTMKKPICSRNVVLELRLRRPYSYRSRLLGRSEVAWADADADALEERRVDLVMKKSVAKGVKVPMLFVRMGMRVIRVLEPREMGRGEHYGECRCESCQWIGSEEDMLMAATMIDAC